MADFKTALEALGQGKVGLDALSKQLDKLLQTTPQHATRLLAQLDEAFGAKRIDNAAYTKLKGQINQYRRTHAKETESAEEGGRDSTVFAQEDNFEKQGAVAKAAAPAGGGARAAAHDSTRVMGDEEKPATGAGVDVDVSQPSLDSSAPSDIPPSTGPTGTKWQTPLSSEAAIAQEMGPGSVIKERFKLMDVLGVGGMGKVYKGVDLLKQEARDKNPYIAIKLLNEDFKSHPEAFIALQRESSRQQKLAHPNIATVYDFDRIGGPGTPVFITMELMEGQPLNNYIKKTVRKQNGLPFPEAFNIVKQLGAALQYAHERRLVHSDFKPGNAFLCNDGTVKTLDFGIARAVKNPVTGEGEKTLFDPGKLGALTPAYASLEMLEGEEPDPRDDIYALGCVAYELLTGKHPYNKLPANTARDNGLIPAPVKGLNKKQNRALRHALAYKREDRSPKVQDFIEEFEGKANLHKNPFFIAAVVLLIVGAIAVQPVRQYFHQKEIEGIIAEINSGNAQTIAAKLEEIRGLEKTDQTTITDEAKTALQKYLTAEVTKHIDITGENYNFPAADVALNAVREFYPDSLFLQERQNEVEFNRKQKLADLYNNYIAALQDTSLLGTTSDILQTIGKRIDPNHPLLTDPRPANAYRLAAEQAMSTGDLEQALTLVSSGLQSAPNDARLADLQKTVQTAKRVGELRETLGGMQFASLTDYKQQEAAIVELAGLVGSGAERPVLGPLAAGLKKTVGEELARVLKSGGRADAQTLADEYGPLLSSLQLQQELTQIKLAHLTGDERTQAIQQIVSADKATVDERLANPKLDDAQWESQLLASVRELDSLKAENAAIAGDLQAYRDRIAALYQEQANNLLQANRFDAAQTFVDRGERFAPGLASLAELRNAIAQSKAALEKQQRIDDLKDRFKVQTEADRVVEAQKIFDELKTILPADDPYITTGAPTVLASSYQRLAERSAASGDMENAVKLARAGLLLAPNNAELQRIANESGVESNITQLTQLFSNATIFTEDEIKQIQLQVDQIEKGAPSRYSEFRRQAETTLAGRVNAMAQSDQNAAGALATAAYRIFPTSSTLEDLSRRYVVKAWPRKAEADAALQTGALTQANRLLQEAAGGEFATHPDVQTLQRTLEARTKEANEKIGGVTSAFESAKQVADRNDRRTALSEVRSKLSPILDIWSDNPDFNSIKAEVDQAIAATMIRGREAEIDVAAAASSAAAAKPWSPVSSDYPCTAGLAGHGARARAICFDLVNTGWRGPPMVVVPAGGNLGKNFAIGKYEISVGDWSKYCALSGKCKPVMDKERHDDPMTGVTLEQAQEYVKWLSERTGKTYRLPTTEEWEYAATVGGAMTPESQEFRAIKGQLNCRVTMGDKVLKGTGTADVKSGGQNKWGLKNFVGNVQELVVDGTGTASVRGGAYSDPIANCEVSTGRPYGGGADDTTGFRVVLDEVG